MSIEKDINKCMKAFEATKKKLEGIRNDLDGKISDLQSLKDDCDDSIGNIYDALSSLEAARDDISKIV